MSILDRLSTKFNNILALGGVESEHFREKGNIDKQLDQWRLRSLKKEKELRKKLLEINLERLSGKEEGESQEDSSSDRWFNIVNMLPLFEFIPWAIVILYMIIRTVVLALVLAPVAFTLLFLKNVFFCFAESIAHTFVGIADWMRDQWNKNTRNQEHYSHRALVAMCCAIICGGFLFIILFGCLNGIYYLFAHDKKNKTATTSVIPKYLENLYSVAHLFLSRCYRLVAYIILMTLNILKNIAYGAADLLLLLIEIPGIVIKAIQKRITRDRGDQYQRERLASIDGNDVLDGADEERVVPKPDPVAITEEIQRSQDSIGTPPVVSGSVLQSHSQQVSVAIPIEDAEEAFSPPSPGAQ